MRILANKESPNTHVPSKIFALAENTLVGVHLRIEHRRQLTNAFLIRRASSHAEIYTMRIV